MTTTYTVFQGHERLTSGDLRHTLTYLKTQIGDHRPVDPPISTSPASSPLAPSAQTHDSVLIFDDRTGQQVDFNLSGSLQDVLARELPGEKASPGRPKLGVVAREVTLLPRHWEWLEQQRGGASATLRRLVEEARKQDPQGEQVSAAQRAADHFMTVLAGNLPGYEDATRALYACNQTGFLHHTASWPEHTRAHALHLAAPAFTQ